MKAITIPALEMIKIIKLPYHFWYLGLVGPTPCRITFSLIIFTLISRVTNFRSQLAKISQLAAQNVLCKHLFSKKSSIVWASFVFIGATVTEI